MSFLAIFSLEAPFWEVIARKIQMFEKNAAQQSKKIIWRYCRPKLGALTPILKTSSFLPKIEVKVCTHFFYIGFPIYFETRLPEK